jgi:hypothetical protein
VVGPPATTGPGLGGAIRSALFDFYYQSIRLVPANLAWGLSLLALAVLWAQAGFLAALAVAPLLAVPYIGVIRLAALTARGRDVVLSDAFGAYRAYVVPAVIAGAGFVAAAALFGTNILVGASTGGVVGWGFATLAAWGLLATWVVALVYWVLLVDPVREGVPVARTARLAALLVLAAPGRLGALGLVVGVVMAVSTVALAALLTISVAYAGLVTARYVLPLADRFEAFLVAREASAGPD